MSDPRTAGRVAAVTVLKAAALIDGSGGPARPDPVVIIEDGKIGAVYQGALPEGSPWSEAHVVEYPGATLLPGLIDCHVHLNLPGDGTPFPDSVRESDGVMVATAVNNAQTALRAGITTLRDCGGRGCTTFDVRRAFELGYAQGSRLVLCGQPITITGGHCWYFGGEADGVEGVRRKARQMAKLGADFIKVMATGGGTPNTISWLPSYRRDEIVAVTDEAHRLGRKIAIHCLCTDAIEYAAEAGADTIEHASFMVDNAGNQTFVPAVADMIARAGARVTPTLSVGRYVVDVMCARQVRAPDEQHLLDRWSHMLEDNLRQLGRLRDAGVTFIAGTDAGWRFTPFDALITELELMHQAGLPAMDTIVAATGGAAAALDIESHTGCVQVGLQADIVAVDGSPLDDLGVLRNIRMVMKGGNVVSASPSANTGR